VYGERLEVVKEFIYLGVKLEREIIEGIQGRLRITSQGAQGAQQT
jgi:hypothetical protein